MAGNVTPLLRVSEEEASLQKEILDLLQKGDASEAVHKFRSALIRGKIPVSAHTYFLAHLAGCDCGEGDAFLARITKMAEGCVDFAKYQLSIQRDKAVKKAERRPKCKRDYKTALEEIDTIITSRKAEEGEESPELPNDWVAKAKILILKGDARKAYDILSEMRGRHEGQTELNVEFWYSISVFSMGWYEHSYHLAKRLLSSEHGDSKPSRRWIWKLMARRWKHSSGAVVYYAAPAVRFAIWWKL